MPSTSSRFGIDDDHSDYGNSGSLSDPDPWQFGRDEGYKDYDCESFYGGPEPSDEEQTLGVRQLLTGWYRLATFVAVPRLANVYVNVNMYERVCIHYVRAHVSARMYLGVYMLYMYIYILYYILYIYIYIYFIIHTHLHTYIHTSMYPCIIAYIRADVPCIYIRTYIHVCMCVYVYVYIYLYLYMLTPPTPPSP